MQSALSRSDLLQMRACADLGLLFMSTLVWCVNGDLHNKCPGHVANGLAAQVRLAFLAGLAVVLLLIPVNRWLAARIEAASAAMMECKDARIRRTSELLQGIRYIKAACWEPAFLARVRHHLPRILYTSRGF